MKKIIVVIFALMLALAGSATAFAADTASVPTDVKGTGYETAVSALVSEGVIVGYPDGTFHPAESISRAAACVIVVKSMGASDAVITAAASNGFTDLAGYSWAAKYINYAAAKGVVSGYPNGTFKPGSQVTYNEMAAMLVRALGYKVTDLSGTWPTNFSNKAKELGMLTGVPFKGDAPALRGYTAMMDYAVAAQIAAANTSGSPTVPSTTGGAVSSDPAGALASYTGRAYGIITDVATTVNAKGENVQQLEFLLGAKKLYVNTKGPTTFDPANLSARLTAGDLFGLKMLSGVVNDVDDSSDNSLSGIGSTKFENLGITSWKTVAAKTDGNVTLTGVAGSFSVLSNASVYVGKVEGSEVTDYSAGTLSDIRVGAAVRLYSVTGDEPGVAEIVLVLKDGLI